MNVDKLNKKNVLNAASLGKDSQSIDFVTLEKPVHCDVVNAIAALKQKAALAGFDLKLASGFRNFDQQLRIWNDKATGKRQVLDENENPINISFIDKNELLFSILRWTALPGSSRHHWGTDFDIFDAAAIDDNYTLQLTVKETKKNGPFEKFYRWLDQYLKSEPNDFFRPYEDDLGGVSVEPWHLSYRPMAKVYCEALSLSLIEATIKSSEIALKEEILKNINEIYVRFIKNVKI